MSCRKCKEGLKFGGFCGSALTADGMFACKCGNTHLHFCMNSLTQVDFLCRWHATLQFRPSYLKQRLIKLTLGLYRTWRLMKRLHVSQLCLLSFSPLDRKTHLVADFLSSPCWLQLLLFSGLPLKDKTGNIFSSVLFYDKCWATDIFFIKLWNIKLHIAIPSGR